MTRYTHTFHYETEMRRYDAPAENAADWLDEQARLIAFRSTGIAWPIAKGRLIPLADKTHNYTVTMTTSDAAQLKATEKYWLKVQAELSAQL